MANKVKFYNRLKIGLTVVGTLIAVADIVMTSITLYEYYNRDHLPIPKYMADLSYSEDRETEIVYYKNVPDQSGDSGDVNGGGGKQWLALYQTRDEDAGEPILAPENGEEFKVIVQYGSSEEPKTEGYVPIHHFDVPGTPQNLTNADGENGWSYNDGKKGTYVFFRRGVKKSENEEKGTSVDGSTTDAGTALGGGTVAMIGAGCGLVGIFIGMLLPNLRKRKGNDQ